MFAVTTGTQHPMTVPTDREHQCPIWTSATHREEAFLTPRRSDPGGRHGCQLHVAACALATPSLISWSGGAASICNFNLCTSDGRGDKDNV